MPRPVILQTGTFPDWDQQPIDEAYEALRLFAAEDSEALLAARGPEVRAIATRGDLGASRALIEACPNLEMIAVYGVGYDAVDIAACRERGVRVTNTPDVLTGDVADLAVAMMLCLARGVVGADAWVRDGSWSAKGGYPLRRRAFGRRAGILGLGRIGHAIGRRLAAFEMEIAYSSRAPKPEAQDWAYVPDPVALARQSDVLFVALAATPETRHIVGREVIEALGPEGMLVNISRAANVDEEALIAALADGRLGGAALDVFEGEPALDPRFLDLPNVLLQPHHGSGTVETRRAMGQLMRDNLAAHFAGRPLLTPVA
jgi:lactate dehydrogenase-like 2-hydroxyacid dehydrogenase